MIGFERKMADLRRIPQAIAQTLPPEVETTKRRLESQTPIASRSKIEANLRRDQIGLKRQARRGQSRATTASLTRRDINFRKSQSGRMRKSWRTRRTGRQTGLVNTAKGSSAVMLVAFRRETRNLRHRISRRALSEVRRRV